MSAIDIWKNKVTACTEEILAQARIVYEETVSKGGFDGSEWFEFLSRGDINFDADVEVWAWDDGDVRVTAYLQYLADDGFMYTDHNVFVSLGVIDHDPSFIYPKPKNN